MQAIIEGNLYEVEPAVKVIIDKLMIENAELKKENARLEEGYQKSLGVIAATDCTECKKDAEPVKHGEWIKTDVCENQFKCSECGRTVTTNAYVLTLNEQDIENLVIKLLETLKEDTSIDNKP